MKIVILADTQWSVGRVHAGIAKYLPEHEFIFHDQSSFFFQQLVNDIRSADVLIGTLNTYIYINSLCVEPEIRKKTLFICHGVSEIKMIEEHPDFNKEFSTDFVYSVTSDVLVPFHPMKVYITPNGIDKTLFTHIERSGKIQNLGWVGAYQVSIKRVDWSYQIADATELSLSIACKIPFDRMNEVYKSIDILLVTSGPDASEETGPLPPLEAIACGAIAIGTPVGNFRNVPGPKFNSIDEAIEIINQLKTNPEMVCALAKEQYNFVMENYTYDTIAQKWNTIIKDIYFSNCNK
jgi:hypothetical protein